MGTIDAVSLVVCDAGPIIHLDELSCLGFLGSFPPIMIPSAVALEIKGHRPGAFDLLPPNVHVTESVPGPSPSLRAIRQALSLGEGETAALCLCQEMPQSMLLTDDLAARSVAVQMGVRVHGTIGILLRAVRIGEARKDDMMATLSGLPFRSSLYIRDDLLNLAIEELSKRP